MGELKLSDGTTVKLDMSDVRRGEWSNVFSGKATRKQDDAFVEKITGLTPEQQEDLLWNDYRRILQAILKEGNKPLTDPN
jgi:hypothetical protein